MKTNARTEPITHTQKTITGIVAQSFITLDGVRTKCAVTPMTSEKGVTFLPFTLDVSTEKTSGKMLTFSNERFRVTAFDGPLSTIASHLTPGTSVTVSGYVEPRTYTRDDGSIGSSLEMRVAGPISINR